MTTAPIVGSTLTREPAPPAATSDRQRHIQRLAFLASLPAVLLVVGFMGVPIVQALRISTSDWEGFGPINFTGFGKYAEQLASSQLYDSLWATLKFATLSTVGIIAIATLLAAAVSRNARGSAFYRVIWFIPGVAPGAAVAVYWSTAFQPGIGTVNVILGYLGLDSSSAPLADAATALNPVIFVNIWASVGFAFILILGALEQVPVTLYEAAQIDGASGVRQFFAITLPLARPVIAITATLNLIWSFNNFTTIWGMTNGGPGEATTTLPVLVYKNAFLNGDYGSATTVAVISGAVLLGLGLLTLKFSQAKTAEA